MRAREAEQRAAYSMGYVSGQLDCIGGMLMGKRNSDDYPFAPLADNQVAWLFSVWCLAHNLAVGAAMTRTHMIDTDYLGKYKDAYQ